MIQGMMNTGPCLGGYGSVQESPREQTHMAENIIFPATSLENGKK